MSRETSREINTVMQYKSIQQPKTDTGNINISHFE